MSLSNCNITLCMINLYLPASIIYLQSVRMSTSSHIRQNNIEYLRIKSPRKSLNLTISPRPTSRSGNILSDDEDSEFDEEDLLRLEIKQIKRQNKFLKKKIKDLIALMEGDKPEKKKFVSKGAPKQNKDPVHQSVQFFFEEINTLINSLVDVFRIQFKPEQIEEYQSSKHKIDEPNPVRKYTIIKKFHLNRKLQTILFDQQENRYPKLLEIFTDFYRTKEESDRFINNFVEQISKKTIQLNKLILEKVQNRTAAKKSRIKSSLSFNSDVRQSQQVPISIQQIKIQPKDEKQNRYTYKTKTQSNNFKNKQL